ncbi:resolvase [Brevibacillus agri]|jgi:DNA invertase Pin-like site-specific DNA recombinase|uniref:Recombinase family protein n=1 Tax=Brevibacillus agri TaxID=51101 RepID=A0A3M8BEJ0_9BACL|nr:recombinase family protein [Brevibacillus agri]ELK43832.1 DNA integration/recombination/inversion protein [Brevibacillus agri BAB-2500]REK67926.1 MAG: recombinase family protein [Brevibacillus sp.]MBY0052880.1 recombinase family protein [Brevibacillus agri]MDN4095424.1 recombinase family protein [Brevibacillus agri]MED3501207.1 recombinase family protein [Brevibacillus agri]
MKTRVVGYVRVSTQGQVKDGYSLAYQVEEIQRFCARHNLELLDIYKDEGISGAKVDEDELTIEREGLQEMLSDLKWRDVKYIVVLNTSRLWRADMVKVLIQRELKRHQADVKAIEQPNYSIYAHDPNDFLVNGMMELLDQYQRLEIALKLSRGRRKKAQQGGYAGGRVALGYKATKGQKTLSVDPVQAQTVRRVFELKEQHPMWSLAQIAAELNQQGFKTVQGKPFSKVQVKRILDREDFYRGIYRYGQIEAKGVHQPII